MSTRRMQKNLTVMFTDISGFTRHTETISRDELMSRLETHNELLMPIIAHFDGKIVKTIGDAFLITFESPTNAVQCGLFMQHTLRKYNVEKAESNQIHIKISINSGEVTVTENDVFGDPVNVSAKIEKATNPDEIYFTEAVFLAMNKAEVPTSFVKSFRPRGAESQEIKLYKVAMDEGDERYQKVVQATHIDAEKVKTRVLELSTAAEKEFNRYQDTLDALVESHGASSRNTIIAVIAAAVILAVAIVIGFAMFGGAEENPEGKAIDTARAHLSASKPEDARHVLVTHIEKHGSSERLSDALAEVDAYELNDATRRAEALLDDGQPEKAQGLIRDALKGKEPGGTQRRVLDRAKAFVGARAAMADGDTATALKKIDAAAGAAGITGELKRLRDQARAIDEVSAMVADEAGLKDKSTAAIERLLTAFGDKPDIPVVNELLIKALKSRLFWEGRTKPWPDAKKTMEGYKQRLIGIPDWPAIEREMHLGGFWSYVGRYDQRDRWWDWMNDKWSEMYSNLKAAAEADADFALRLGFNVFEINRAMSQAIDIEQVFIADAIKRKPALLDQNRPRIKDMCIAWLEYGHTDDEPARELIRLHFFDELRPVLIEGLNAEYAWGDPGRPNPEKRQNCLALLADRGELELADSFAYFRDNFEIFMQNAWSLKDNKGNPQPTGLTRAQVRALFALPINLEVYREFRDLLERTITDLGNRQGRWSSYTYSLDTARAMLDDLKAAQPLHAGG